MPRYRERKEWYMSHDIVAKQHGGTIEVATEPALLPNS